MSSPSDFLIENGVLKKYAGPGGDVVVPEGVTKIDFGAFYDCETMRSVFLPEGVTLIDGLNYGALFHHGAFTNCRNLEQVSFPKSLQWICAYAFMKCISLKRLILPDGLKEIGVGAFCWCGSLEEVSVPKTVSNVCDGAFFNCKKLTCLNLPEGLTNVGDQALSGCTALRWVKSPVNLSCGMAQDCSFALIQGRDKKKYLAFAANSEDRKSSNVSEFAHTGMWPQYDLELINNGPRYQYKLSARLIGALGRLADPVELTEENRLQLIALVKRNLKAAAALAEETRDPWIAKALLETVGTDEKKRTVLKALFCASTVSEIAALVPEDDPVRSIPPAEKQVRRSVRKPDQGLSASEARKTFKVVFSGEHEAWITGYKSDAEEVVIPSRVGGSQITIIDDRAFRENKRIKSVVIPEGVQTIRDEAFSACRSLERVILPQSLTSIGRSAFSGCSSLKSITLPESVTSIGDWAFSGCSSFNSVALPEGVTSIGDWAFSGCSSLNSISLPESVTSIGDNAFSDCISLKNIALPEGVTSIGWSAFRGCNSLTSMTLPDSVMYIGVDAFADCSSLTNITLLAGMTYIGRGAFANCSLVLRVKRWLPDLKDALQGCTVRAIVTEDFEAVPQQYRIPAAIGFAMEPPEDLSTSLAKKIMSWLTRNSGKLIEEAFLLPNVLIFLREHRLLKPSDADVFLREAQKRNDTERTAELLEYLNSFPRTAEPEDAFSFSDEDRELTRALRMAERQEEISGQKGIRGIAFVCTGELKNFGTYDPRFGSYDRSDLKAYIEARGGFLRGSVSSKTDYLICNDLSFATSKIKKAAELGVPVITEEEFLKMANETG